MRPPVGATLIVGGGFSGMSAAIALAKLGVPVDLVEIDASLGSYGTGITLSGSSLRALGVLGVLPEVIRRGAGTDGVDIFSARGDRIVSLPTPRIAGPDVPGGAGILRPVLGNILAEATRASGVDVRLGITFESMLESAEQVDVSFSDGTRRSYELVVGADGLFSKLRCTLFPEAPAPRYTGQSVWRVLTARGSVERPAMYLGARAKAGYNPVSHDEMYLFVTENHEHKRHVSAGEAAPLLAELLAEFEAPAIAHVRDGLSEASPIVFRPLEALLVPLPWAKGRLVLIGDAVHATTPHLASGAGIGIEDAIVLADEIARADSLAPALDAFQARRWERCRLVVENSLRLGDLERLGDPQGEHPQLMRQSMLALAAPF